MIRNLHFALGLVGLLASGIASANVCDGRPAELARNVHVSAWASGDEVYTESTHLLGTAPTERLSLNAVLLRRQLGACGPADEFAGYVPKTEHDNTPWRFNAGEGKRLSAAEFDAWMKSRGVRVARGRGEAAASEEPAVVSQ
jgi:hypothetical protein